MRISTTDGMNLASRIAFKEIFFLHLAFLIRNTKWCKLKCLVKVEVQKQKKKKSNIFCFIWRFNGMI